MMEFVDGPDNLIGRVRIWYEKVLGTNRSPEPLSLGLQILIPTHRIVGFLSHSIATKVSLQEYQASDMNYKSVCQMAKLIKFVLTFSNRKLTQT